MTVSSDTAADRMMLGAVLVWAFVLVMLPPVTVAICCVAWEAFFKNLMADET